MPSTISSVPTFFVTPCCISAAETLPSCAAISSPSSVSTAMTAISATMAARSGRVCTNSRTHIYVTSKHRTFKYGPSKRSSTP